MGGGVANVKPHRETLDQLGFRQQFPALDRWAWLDTPGSPPGARPVLDVMRELLSTWERGEFAWREWDAAAELARTAFASLVGVDDSRVSVLGSVAEGVATVAKALPPGSIVVADSEYRSVLFPLIALDQDVHPVIRVAASGDVVTADDLAAAIRPDTVLVAVSDTLTSTGDRVDLVALRAATDTVGARLMVDLTQSLGVLDHDIAAMNPDFIVVHGYKWLLCPRGAAWLVTRPDRLEELAPLLPSWKSTDPPYGYFGGDLQLPASGSKLDTSPAWFSWVGAIAALDLISRLDVRQVEAHCVGLARRWVAGATELGYRPIAPEQNSHIAVVDVGDVGSDLAIRLAAADVKASVMGTRLRIGVHYFVNDDDIDRALAAIIPRSRPKERTQ